MSRKQATLLAILGTLGGLGLLAYLLLWVSPYDEGGQLSAWALLLFFAGLLLLAGGLATLLALAAHRRWPALAGRTARGRTPPGRPAQPPAADAALRQGLLAGLVVAVLLALSILRVLDVTFFLVTLLLAGLVEAYAQTRR